MKKVGIGVLCILLIGALAVSAMAVGRGPTGKGKGGFDEYGYNYKARIFNGLFGNYDRDADGDSNKAWGDDNDVTTIDAVDYIVPVAGTHLVMKWSKAWDDARFGGGDWTEEAWVTNHDTWVEGNGKTHTAYYKIEWTGPGGELWGEFTITRAIYDGQKIR